MNIRLLVLVVFTFLAACGGGSSSSGGSADAEKLILVLGDSIGTGTNASTAYPDFISAFTGIPVVNASVGGFSAEQGVGLAQDLIDEHNPRYIVALLGTNNAKGAAGGVSGAISSMNRLSQICAENGVVCIIGTLPPITRSSGENDNVNEINAGYWTVAGVRIADNSAVMSSSDISSDGVHPNDAGQLKIGQTFTYEF